MLHSRRLLSVVAPCEDLARGWRFAEDLGLDSAWVNDDLNTPGWGADFEAWSLMGALARETTRIRIGILVTVVTFRHPALDRGVLARAGAALVYATGGAVRAHRDGRNAEVSGRLIGQRQVRQTGSRHGSASPASTHSATPPLP